MLSVIWLFGYFVKYLTGSCLRILPPDNPGCSNHVKERFDRRPQYFGGQATGWHPPSEFGPAGPNYSSNLSLFDELSNGKLGDGGTTATQRVR